MSMVHKDLILDRILNGTHLLTKITFVCVVNSHLKLPKVVQDLLSVLENPVQNLSLQYDMKGLVYKIYTIPEKFHNFILPTNQKVPSN
jgi:hypothetical protein